MGAAAGWALSCYQVTRQLTSREDSPWVNSPRSSGPDVSNADGTRLPTAASADGEPYYPIRVMPLRAAGVIVMEPKDWSQGPFGSRC